jgi:uncharacterized protein YegP (UPF0339 family)
MNLCFFRPRYTLHVVKNHAGQWYVQARAKNGELLFVTERYTRESDAVRAAEAIQAARFRVVR